MGLTAASLKYILKISTKYHLRGPVLTLGNQDIYATAVDLQRWAKHLKINRQFKITPSTSSDLNRINPQSANFVHAKTFFQLLGIKESDYYDIDKFKFDSPKIIHDLQQPLPMKYHRFFNFIVDCGTLEHIFDVKSVMVNTALALKKNGYILQMIPANNFLNHGFYQFSPTFFYDFYESNGFKVIESYVVETRPNASRFHYYQQSRDYCGLFFNPYSRLGSVFLVKKIKYSQKITNPTQYIYQKMALNPSSVESDFRQTKFDRLVSWLRNKIPFRFHGLFFTPWWFIKQITGKHRYFDIDFQ